MSEDKISIPKLRIKELKGLAVIERPDDDLSIMRSDLLMGINNVLDELIQEDTENINYAVVIWDSETPNLFGSLLLNDHTSIHEFLLPEYIKNAVQKSIDHRFFSRIE